MKKIILDLLLGLFWVVMAIVLLVAGTLVCGVRLLRPDVLTPAVCRIANENLNAQVSLRKIELAFEPAFPILKLKLDSLTVVSNVFDGSVDGSLPQYADTLLTLDAFRGDVDILKLIAKGEVALGDVEFVRPAINVVLDKDGRGNFDIYESTEEGESTDDTPIDIPAISIRRFAFVEPREIRYFNAADSAEATVVLLSDASLNTAAAPVYKVSVEGRLGGPYAGMLNLEDVGFGLDGAVRWNPDDPRMIAVENMKLYGAFVRAALDTKLTFDSTLTVDDASFILEPLKVTDAITVLPENVRREYRLHEPFFTTDATLRADMKLLRPFNVGRDSIPYADVKINLDKCAVRYGKAVITDLSLAFVAGLRGNDPDSISASFDGHVEGPATALTFSGEATRLISDPAFNFKIDGKTVLDKLPPVLVSQIPGYLTGVLNMSLNGSGTASMLTANRLHELAVTGRLEARELYYRSEDTAKMVVADGLRVRFGSQVQGKNSELPPSMAADIALDTAAVLIDGVRLNIGDLHLGAAVENGKAPADSNTVVPIGAAMKLGKFNVLSITDSAGVRMRGLNGRVSLRRFKGNDRLPLIMADLGVDVMAAGSMDSRLFLRDAKIHATTYKNPVIARRRAQIKHYADSIHRRNPSLSPDSVMRLAIEKRMHRPGAPRKRRVQSKMTDEDLEVIDWGLSSGLKKFLFDWNLEGYVRTSRARIFTPYFPLRNRIDKFDISFTTDSVRLNGIHYSAGASDMALEGIISNIKRGMTSERSNSPLKINLSISSDTIDVNQISAAAFAGSAYAHRKSEGRADFSMSSDENELEQQMEALVEENTDSVGPLLIPTNIDGNLKLGAKNVLYDKITFKNLGGDILISDGAVTLHDLQATSDAGSMSLSALYSAPKVSDMEFGMGLKLKRFNIERFLEIVPAIDSIMPLMRDFSGIINADIAATVDIDSTMNFVLPTLDAAVKLTGDSIAFINPETYRKIGKWLRFRDKADNKIKRMSVEMIVRDNMLQLFPFSFEIDRYKLGVLGHNDLAINFDYHISVLESPLPFRFGVNIKGNPEKFKVRFGGAKYKDNMAVESVAIVDSARVNLVRQIENVFVRGVKNSRFAKLDISAPLSRTALEGTEPVLSAADSTAMIREGILPAPVVQETAPVEKKTNKNRKQPKKNKAVSDAVLPKE